MGCTNSCLGKRSLWAGTLLLATIVAASSAFAAKTYYKWVDNDGVTHYSEHKPQGATNAQEVSVFTGRSEPTTNVAGKPQEEGDQPGTEATDEKIDPEALKDPERCRIARKNLETMQNNNRIRMKDPGTGEYRFLSEEEKQQQMKDAQQAIDESC